MLVGILCGLLTGALWGLTFVAPRAVLPFTELDLAIARYGIFGFASLALMLHPTFRPQRVTWETLRIAIILGGTGYVGYYVAVAFAVRLAGPAIPPLVIGALPVILAIIGNWQERDSGRQVRWRALALPLAFIAAGLAVVNADALEQASFNAAQADVALGTLCAVVALLIWVIYAIINARAMRGADAPASLPWTGLQGLGAAIGTLPLIPISWASGASAWPTQALISPAALSFYAWALVLGIAGSWLATLAWVVASRRLPLALSAQLIVAETVFALAYGFAFEVRWPRAAEWLGSGLLVAGVIVGVAVFSARRDA